jgi:hypothetical protein
MYVCMYVRTNSVPAASQTELKWLQTQCKAKYRYGEEYLSSGPARYPLSFLINCDSLLKAEGPYHQKFMALIASVCLSGGMRLRSESHNYTITNVHSQLLFNQLVFNSYKNQNDSNHSNFHPGTAVLGFKLRLPCYNFKNNVKYL